VLARCFLSPVQQSSNSCVFIDNDKPLGLTKYNGCPRVRHPKTKFMNTKLFNLSLTVALLFSVTCLQAQEEKYKKQKFYSKSYGITSSDKISLDNQFGDIKLATWNKNEIKVDVHIMTSSAEEERAQKLLDGISIQDEKKPGSVSFKTVIAKQEKQKTEINKKFINEGMKITYTVFLPPGNPLTAKNHFGALIIPDYKGEVNLESQFGSLTAGKLTNVKQVTVKFGKTTIAQVNNGRINIDYTPTATINKLTGDVQVNLQFSAVKLEIDNDASSINIMNSHSDIYLDVSRNLSASYKINTSYGGFNNKSNFTVEAPNKPGNTKNYSGKSGNGDASITVNSTFGGVVLGHDLKIEQSKKAKGENLK